MTENQLPLQLQSDVYIKDIPANLWIRDCVGQGMRSYVNKEWPTQVREFPGDDSNSEVVCKSTGPAGSVTLYGNSGDSLFHLRVDRGKIEVNIASQSDEDCKETAALLAKLFPRPSFTEETLPVAIWHKAGCSGESIERKLEVPIWANIQGNYARSTRDGLVRLMEWEKAPSVGKIILWRGDPGTGKSFALRALANQWRNWCKMDYITDPENFLGSDTRYLMKLIIGDEVDYEECEEGPLTRLLVMEDAGRLIRIDASETEGQAVARLLNLSDGILGQGLRNLVLITTNEELGRLNPALTRNGRCISQIDFKPFSDLEAREWAVSNGVFLDTTKKERVLGDLYSLKDNPLGPQQRVNGLGFVTPKS